MLRFGQSDAGTTVWTRNEKQNSEGRRSFPNFLGSISTWESLSSEQLNVSVILLDHPWRSTSGEN